MLQSLKAQNLRSKLEETLAKIELAPGLKISVGLHAGVILFALIQTLIFQPEPYIPTLKVDLVALPDVLKNDLQKIGKQTKPSKVDQILERPEPADPNAMTLPNKKDEKKTKEKEKKKEVEAEEKREEKMNNALAKIKALSKIDEAGTVDKIKGNILSEGKTISGDARESAEATYYDSIHDEIKQNWTLPLWLSRQEFSAQVVLFIDAQGRVADLQFKKQSGNAQFDAAVKKAILDSQPFTPPPKDYLKTVLVNGILLGFPL